MENKLEQLLNSLIEKGWKPFGYNDFTKATVEENENVPGKKVIHLWTDLGIDTESLIRIICMKESGLWQFVCENGMVKRPRGEAPEDVRVWRYVETMGIIWSRCFGKKTPEFYIIESALKDESELEQFLLSNIKID